MPWKSLLLNDQKARNKKLRSSKISSPNKNSQEIRKFIQETYQALTKIHKKPENTFMQDIKL